MSEVFFGGGFIFAATCADGIRVDDIERCAELAGELDGIETANGQMVIFINVNMRIKNHFFSLRFAPPLSAKLLKVLIKLFQKFAVSKGGALVASAEAKLSFRRFSFCLAFSFAPASAKEKAENGLSFTCVRELN